MDKGEARARLIALAETTPKGAQRDALVMGANALIEDIANQWLEEHDKLIIRNVITSLSQIQLGYGNLDEYKKQLEEIVKLTI